MSNRSWIAAIVLILLVAPSGRASDYEARSPRDIAEALEAARLVCIFKHRHRFASDDPADPMFSFTFCRVPEPENVPTLCGRRAPYFSLVRFKVVHVNGQRVYDIFVLDRGGAVFSTRSAQGFARFLAGYGDLRCTADGQLIEFAETFIHLTYGYPLSELRVCSPDHGNASVAEDCPPVAVVEDERGKRLDLLVTTPPPYHEEPVSVLWTCRLDAEGVPSCSREKIPPEEQKKSSEGGQLR